MEKHFLVTTVWADGFRREDEAPSFEQAKNGFEIYIEDPDCRTCFVSVWTEMYANMVLYYDKRGLEG